MSERYFIYGLRDPRTMEIRYVGQTSRGWRRPQQHGQASSLRNHADSYVVHWLKSIDLRHEIVVLERLDIDHLSAEERRDALDASEIYWIAIGRVALGSRLTNRTEGGNSPVFTEEARTRMSESRLAYFASSEGVQMREHLSSARKAFFETPKGQLDLQEQLRRLSSPEVVAKMTETIRAGKLTPEGLEQSRLHSEFLRRKFSDPEERKKLAAAKRAQMATPEGKVQAAVAVRAMNTPESRAQRVATLRATVATPAGRATCLNNLALGAAAAHTPEAHAKKLAAFHATTLQRHLKVVPRFRINLLSSQGRTK